MLICIVVFSIVTLHNIGINRLRVQRRWLMQGRLGELEQCRQMHMRRTILSIRTSSGNSRQHRRINEHRSSTTIIGMSTCATNVLQNANSLRKIPGVHQARVSRGRGAWRCRWLKRCSLIIVVVVVVAAVVACCGHCRLIVMN
jgi:hypothetical protein